MKKSNQEGKKVLDRLETIENFNIEFAALNKDEFEKQVALSYWLQSRFAEARCVMTDGINNDHMIK